MVNIFKKFDGDKRVSCADFRSYRMMVRNGNYQLLYVEILIIKFSGDDVAGMQLVFYGLIAVARKKHHICLAPVHESFSRNTLLAKMSPRL